ncbi:MAG TPA: hypothetical protein VFU82_07120 [Gammaproteobacteria bacterium]|nr:hypothetical protein [Gammaproteobacteria bacterium]
MSKIILEGKVTKINKVEGMPNPHSYIIKDNKGHTYLVHVGDLKENENLLYKLYKEDKTAKLKVGDVVKFEPDIQRHAIHVKKAP